MSYPQIVLPGEPLGALGNLNPGPGTHVQNGQIIASIAGVVKHTTNNRDTSSKSRSTQTISVALDLNTNSSDVHATPRLPTVGAIVYGRITVVQRVQALCVILALQSSPAAEVSTCEWPLRGILRSQDVRMTEKDRVKMHESVAVGDIVRAEVVSLGDQGGYYLSTAGNELGVVMAWSKMGNVCVPVSWKEVADEVTGVREERKVAKPV